MYWTYILQNEEGVFYVGQTDDLARRLLEHNQPPMGLGKYTNKHGPWKIVWSESHPSRALAMACEREIKNWKSSRLIRQKLLGQIAESRRSRD